MLSQSARNLFLVGIPRGSTAPARGRRTTQNGRSPLTITSPEQGRHVKYAGGQGVKVAATQSDIKSPPIAGNFTHAGAPGGVSSVLFDIWLWCNFFICSLVKAFDPSF